MRTRFTRLFAVALGLICPPISTSIANSAFSTGIDEWRAYAGSNASLKYSALKQITAANAKRLKIAWRWASIDAAILKEHPEIRTWKFESTPIIVGKILYTSTSLSQVAAIDAETGRTIWSFDPRAYCDGRPPNFGFVHRGVAYWADKSHARIFVGTANGYLIALNAKTGKPIDQFGRAGRIDLTRGLVRSADRSLYGVNSPPLICRNTVIVGSTIIDFPKVNPMPRGDVRGYDVRTGKLRWTFHTIPLAGEPGADTWLLPKSLQEVGAANVWAPMAADDALGYVYLPVSSPSSDFYGGGRPGNNLFGDSLVCLDARSGKLAWSFQMVHHDLWDRDPPAAPILTDIQIGAKTIRAVSQVTKQGFVYVLDRISGKPIWPIEERIVPRSEVPGERSAVTQPIPSRPAAFDRQGLAVSDLIDFTPSLREEALTIVSKLDYGSLFLPPTEKGAILLPGVRGGASWSGAAYDPQSNILYVPSVSAPSVIRLEKSTPSQGHVPQYHAVEDWLPGPQGLPISKPPYGRITAIDLRTGNQVWTEPMGDGPRNHPALRGLRLGRLGWPYRGFPLVTSTLLFVAQEGPQTRTIYEPNGQDGTFSTLEPSIQVFDKCTGRLLAEAPLPSNASGAMMTYIAGNRQYIVMAVGGGQIPAELVALNVR